MRKEYELSKMKGRKNPYSKRLKKQITIRLDTETIEYFKELAIETGLPYQNLIDMYLKESLPNSSYKTAEYVSCYGSNIGHSDGKLCELKLWLNYDFLGNYINSYKRF